MVCTMLTSLQNRLLSNPYCVKHGSWHGYHEISLHRYVLSLFYACVPIFLAMSDDRDLLRSLWIVSFDACSKMSSMTIINLESWRHPPDTSEYGRSPDGIGSSEDVEKWIWSYIPSRAAYVCYTTDVALAGPNGAMSGASPGLPLVRSYESLTLLMVGGMICVSMRYHLVYECNQLV